jgi:hypothetical protein
MGSSGLGHAGYDFEDWARVGRNFFRQAEVAAPQSP